MPIKLINGFVTKAAIVLIIIVQLSFNVSVTHDKPAPSAPREMKLFGEEVPLFRHDIWEDLDREFVYNFHNKAHMIYMLKLSKRFFPILEERLKQQGLPDDFKFLCMAESNLQNMISKSGAVGYWQFMRATSAGYNLEVTNNIDERYDLLKSTDAACKYLKIAYSKFGSWTAAAASYNCGMAGYSAAASFQQTNNYYDLHLPEETNKYIFRILAFKYILTNAAELGLQINEEEYRKEIPNQTVTVSHSIQNLAVWAKENGTNYKMLRRMNPWIRGKSIIVRPGKSYEIKLPLK